MRPKQFTASLQFILKFIYNFFVFLYQLLCLATSLLDLNTFPADLFPQPSVIQHNNNHFA